MDSGRACLCPEQCAVYQGVDVYQAITMTHLPGLSGETRHVLERQDRYHKMFLMLGLLLGQGQSFEQMMEGDER